MRHIGNIFNYDLIILKYIQILINYIDLLFSKLLDVNKQLWTIEDNIRQKEKKEKFDEEFIEIARSVYFTNDKRCEIKNEINILTNSSIYEVKSYEKYD